MLLKKIKVILVLAIVSLSSISIGTLMVRDFSPSSSVLQSPLPLNPLNGSFEFASFFTRGYNFSDYGWLLRSGNTTPTISSAPNYHGEPSIALAKRNTLFSDSNVVAGDHSVSFQFAISALNGTGSFAVTDTTGSEVASISVNGSNVSVNSSGGGPPVSGNIPASPYGNQGWTLISGSLFNSTEGNGWRLQVFVGSTAYPFANVSAPAGYSYEGVELSATGGTVYFTDIIFTSYRIGLYIPGYNNMEGYGQGSGSLVSLLKPFTILHANFVLYNWSVARYSTLSFQINAMNLTGAERPTANGFFQLGVDLDPNGKIAPWYVPGKNAIALYYRNHPSPDYMPGFVTPNGTVLGLTIQYVPSEEKIIFQVVDYSVDNQYRYWNVSIPYSGPEFYAAYTQIETSPMNGTEPNGYRFNGSMYNISYGSDLQRMTLLNSSYMLPYSIDAPPAWSMTYYDDTMAGYRQVD